MHRRCLLHAPFDSEIRYGGDFNKRAMSQFERDKQMLAGRLLQQLQRPVVVEYTDYMTCGYDVPDRRLQDCDKAPHARRAIDLRKTTASRSLLDQQGKHRYSDRLPRQGIRPPPSPPTVPDHWQTIPPVSPPSSTSPARRRNLTEDGATVQVTPTPPRVRPVRARQNCVSIWSMKSLDGSDPSDPRRHSATFSPWAPTAQVPQTPSPPSKTAWRPRLRSAFSVAANNTSTVVGSPARPAALRHDLRRGLRHRRPHQVRKRRRHGPSSAPPAASSSRSPGGYQTKGGHHHPAAQPRSAPRPAQEQGHTSREPEYADLREDTICFCGSDEHLRASAVTATQPTRSARLLDLHGLRAGVVLSLSSVEGSTYKKYTDGVR